MYEWPQIAEVAAKIPANKEPNGKDFELLKKLND